MYALPALAVAESVEPRRTPGGAAVAAPVCALFSWQPGIAAGRAAGGRRLDYLCGGSDAGRLAGDARDTSPRILSKVLAYGITSMDRSTRRGRMARVEPAAWPLVCRRRSRCLRNGVVFGGGSPGARTIASLGLQGIRGRGAVRIGSLAGSLARRAHSQRRSGDSIVLLPVLDELRGHRRLGTRA